VPLNSNQPAKVVGATSSEGFASLFYTRCTSCISGTLITVYTSLTRTEKSWIRPAPTFMAVSSSYN